MSDHKVKLTDKQKYDWFSSQIEERRKVTPVRTEQELIELVRFLRNTFRQLYDRDVSGSFIARLLSDFGVKRQHSDGVKLKRDYMYWLMDTNKAFRDNKTQCRNAVEVKFDEKILGIVFDELWEAYHQVDDHPEPTQDVDIYGQKSILD